ncbi:TonB-dependent receptor [Thalassotalea euphylliae]|uniref:TonB-dependent receptor n=1 Tax=Thalassotalea euphylliae TaxID=1655234 RepID=A0A3E0TSM9_9GAMM|nr:TonB-dependent receptor [Thalassotalea euphylliae]REL27489.1 TonB-dependent receptor [Thalassotalea euphylliae]
MNKSFQASKVAFCVGLAVSAGNVVAEEMAEASAIEKIEVTGQRILGVDVVDLSDIRKKQANDLEDIFRGEPAITVGGSFGIAQKIYVRGIEDTNLNVSVDGATQAGYLFHHQGRLSIEPEMLKHVEVKAGAGSALDGPGALGGAIRFETKDADDLLGDGEHFGALLKAGYFSNTSGTKLSGSFYGRVNDNWSGLLIVGKTDSDNIEDGNGVELGNTKTNQDLGLVKINGILADNHELELSHEIRNDDGVRNVRPHFITAGWNPANEQKSRRETSTANYFYTPENELVDLKVTAFKTDSYLTQNEGNDSRDGAGVESTGFDIRNTSVLAAHEITYGIEQRKDTGYYINGSDVEEKAKVVAIYAQDTFDLTNNLTLSIGARFDDYELDDSDGQHFEASGLSPNISALYQINDHWSVRTRYSEAIRGQKVKEAYLIGFRSNATDLKEEEAKNTDLMLAYENDGLLLSAQVYDSRVDGVVGTVRRADGRFFANAGDLKTTGYTLSAAKQWDNAQVSVNYSNNEPELDGEPLGDSDLGLGTAFGDTLTISSNYVFDSLDLELGWNARLVKSLSDVPQSRPNKPGYGVHDFYVEWYPMADDKLSLNLSLNNAFDKLYYDHGTYGYSTSSEQYIGLAEAGRDVRLTISYKL